VHSFAADPERGLFILWLLVLAVGGALTLYGLRAPTIGSWARYQGLSREFMLLANNLLLVLVLAVVLIGTLYPLAYEAITGGEKMSVGAPYFNKSFVPLALVLAAALALAPIARWKRTPLKLFAKAGVAFAIALGFGVLLPLALTGTIKPGALVAVAAGTWIASVLVVDLRHRRGALTRAYLGMVLAHFGFAVSMVGIGVTSQFSHELDVKLAVGESADLNGVTYLFRDLRAVQGPNYVADQGVFVTDSGVTLRAEKRRYAAGGQVMTEAGIAAGFTRDLYVALGEPLPDGAWGVRINDKPLVRWVWLGALLMAAGGVLAVLDRRYRRLGRRARPAPQAATPAAGAQAIS